MEVDRDYDCKIVLLGNQASNYPHATESVTSSVNARIGTIYSYSYGTSQLTSEYVSSMTSHSKDMMNYIWSESGEYRAVKVWVDTGRYSGGYFEKAVYHKDSKQYQAYGNWFYETFVPGAANVQAHADKLEFLAGIAGAANQSYNPYTGTVNHATNSQGPSTGNEIYKDTNSSIGNTGQGSVGNSTSPSGHVTQGNSTTNGYTEPGNTNPGYVPPSASNEIGTIQGSNQSSGTVDSKLMKELESSGVKYNKNDVVMITKTPDGKLLWLENGSSSSGLKHIVDGHATDFTAKGVNDIPSFLNKTLQTTPVSTGTTASGPFAVYSVGGNLYKVAYGTNGYIVSFYPISKY